MADGPLESDARRIHRNRWAMGAALMPLMAILPALLTAAIVHVGFLAVVPHLLFGGLVLAVYAWRKNAWPELRDVRVCADGAGLQVDELRIARGEITRGVLVEHAEGNEVRLSRKRRPDLQLVVREESEGKLLLGALGLDVHQSVATFNTGSRARAGMLRSFFSTLGGMFGTLVLGVVAAVIHTPLAPVGFGLGILLMLVLLFGGTRVDVGRDGVLMTWFGRRRFISHADIAWAGVTIDGFGRSRQRYVELHLLSDKSVVFPMGLVSFDDGDAEALAQRISAALYAYRTNDATPDASLERGRRTHAEWVAALRRKLLTGHRTAAIPKDSLLQIVEDPAASRVERAAAAIALGREPADDDRRRVAQSARASAAPKLRVVLEGAAEADDDVLAEQLAELEKEESAERRA